MAGFESVDHDPFSGGPYRGSNLGPLQDPKFEPVDHDPFAPTTSPAGQMLVDFGNQGVAAGQRTSPVISAQMPNLISDQVHENDAGEAMYVDPKTDQLMPTDSAKHVILRDPNDNTLKVFARTPDTNEGIPSALGRLLGTGMAAGRMAVSKAAPSAISAAER